MKIKVANKDDFKRIEPVLLEVEHYHVALEPEIFRQVDSYDQNYFNQVIENENQTIFYAEIGREIAGVLIAIEKEYPQIPIFVGGVYVEVEELSVTKRYRRMGVAKALMAHVEKWAISRGCTTMQLSVWARNTGAVAVYEKLGYRKKLVRYTKSLKS